jgi:hypothetical protein
VRVNYVCVCVCECVCELRTHKLRWFGGVEVLSCLQRGDSTRNLVQAVARVVCCYSFELLVVLICWVVLSVLLYPCQSCPSRVSPGSVGSSCCSPAS